MPLTYPTSQDGPKDQNPMCIMTLERKVSTQIQYNRLDTPIPRNSKISFQHKEHFQPQRSSSTQDRRYRYWSRKIHLICLITSQIRLPQCDALQMLIYKTHHPQGAAKEDTSCCCSEYLVATMYGKAQLITSSRDRARGARSSLHPSQMFAREDEPGKSFFGPKYDNKVNTDTNKLQLSCMWSQQTDWILKHVQPSARNNSKKNKPILISYYWVPNTSPNVFLSVPCTETFPRRFCTKKNELFAVISQSKVCSWFRERTSKDIVTSSSQWFSIFSKKINRREWERSIWFKA